MTQEAVIDCLLNGLASQGRRKFSSVPGVPAATQALCAIPLFDERECGSQQYHMISNVARWMSVHLSHVLFHSPVDVARAHHADLLLLGELTLSLSKAAKVSHSVLSMSTFSLSILSVRTLLEKLGLLQS